LTVPPGDPAALAAALRTLLDDPPRRAAMGAAARRRVHEEFSAELMARRTLEVYREVAGAALPSHDGRTRPAPPARSSRSYD
jgi:glycosyltransferase involved in cell wall biosynthesis